MAKVKGPLFSLEAHGNLASGLLQFRVDRGRAHVYKPQPPKRQNQQPASEKQATQRERFGIIKQIWAGLSPIEKAGWEAQARSLGTMKGWNLFLAELLPTSSVLIRILTTHDGTAIVTSQSNEIILTNYANN